MLMPPPDRGFVYQKHPARQGPAASRLPLSLGVHQPLDRAPPHIGGIGNRRDAQPRRGPGQLPGVLQREPSRNLRMRLNMRPTAPTALEPAAPPHQHRPVPPSRDIPHPKRPISPHPAAPRPAPRTHRPLLHPLHPHLQQPQPRLPLPSLPHLGLGLLRFGLHQPGHPKPLHPQTNRYTIRHTRPPRIDDVYNTDSSEASPKLQAPHPHPTTYGEEPIFSTNDAIGSLC